jgi:hypothetical protein
MNLNAIPAIGNLKLKEQWLNIGILFSVLVPDELQNAPNVEIRHRNISDQSLLKLQKYRFHPAVMEIAVA